MNILPCVFDITKNQVLPKSPIGQTYYSRQLYYYVLRVVHHCGPDQPLRRYDVHLYTWLEHQNAKDRTTVASGLHQYFGTVARRDLNQVRDLRLLSDSR